MQYQIGLQFVSKMYKKKFKMVILRVRQLKVKDTQMGVRIKIDPHLGGYICRSPIMEEILYPPLIHLIGRKKKTDYHFL